MSYQGVLTQAGHPDIGIWGGRLVVLVWVVAVVGVPLLLEGPAGSARGGSGVITRLGDGQLKPVPSPGTPSECR